MRTIQKRSILMLRIATGLLLALAVGSNAVKACSWDYPIWQIRSKTADPLYRFIRNGKAGYIDQTGRIVVPPNFDAYGNSGDAFQDGLLHLGVTDGRYVDGSGKLVIERNYESAWDFSEGLAAAMAEGTRRWGYIDRTGEFVIPPTFETYPQGYVWPFSDGMAMIKADNKYGYIGRTGKFLIEPTFLHGESFHDGMAWVVVDGPCMYWDLAPCGSSEVVPRGSSAQTMCRVRSIDSTGTIKSEPFEAAKDFSEGLAPVMSDGKWGFIDKSGRVVIQPQFDEAEPFSDGMALVKQGELWGYVDKVGAMAIKPQFQRAEDFADGLAPVGKWDDPGRIRGDFYFVNKRGESVFREHFEMASPFFKGLAHVRLRSTKPRSDDDWDENEIVTHAYINTAGKHIFTYRFRAGDTN